MQHQAFSAEVRAGLTASVAAMMFAFVTCVLPSDFGEASTFAIRHDLATYEHQLRRVFGRTFVLASYGIWKVRICDYAPQPPLL